MVGQLGHLEHEADVFNGLALSYQLLGSPELDDDLLGGLPGAFHGRLYRPVLSDEESHLPRTYFWGLCQADSGVRTGPPAQSAPQVTTHSVFVSF